MTLGACHFESMWLWEHVTMGASDFGSIWLPEYVSLRACAFRSVWLWEHVTSEACDFSNMWLWEHMTLGAYDFGSMWLFHIWVLLVCVWNQHDTTKLTQLCTNFVLVLESAPLSSMTRNAPSLASITRRQSAISSAFFLWLQDQWSTSLLVLYQEQPFSISDSFHFLAWSLDYL